MSSVLVIAAGGLGPFVQMLGALAALRSHHRHDHITLLTAPETMSFAADARVADDIWCDPRIARWDIKGLRKFRDQLRAKAFAQVYDLDGGPPGRLLFRLMHGWFVPAARRAAVRWCGDIPGVDGFHADAQRDAVHRCDRVAAQLAHAGLVETPAVDLTWVARQVTSFKMPFRMTEPFVLVAGDPHPYGAGWPIEQWVRFGKALGAAGLVPLLTGLRPAPDVREALAAGASRTIDLTGHGVLADLVFLAWAAHGAVGCDNGLMHLFAAAGCRAVVLYDSTSDPARTGQRGRDVAILRRPALAQIPASEVLAALRVKMPGFS